LDTRSQFAESSMVFKRPAASVVAPAASEEEADEVAVEVAKEVADEVAEEAEEMAVDEEAPIVLKRPAAKETLNDVAGKAPELESAQEEAAGEEAKAEDPAEALARQEEETKTTRRKELKGTLIDDLKRLVEAAGLELSKKEMMVDRLTQHEAAVRAEERAKQARIRQVVVDKKEELEALSIPELKDRCAEEGVKGNLTKQARIETLVKLWLEDDGAETAVAKLARDDRERELSGMNINALEKLCKKVAIDPFVKEVIADRIVRREHAAGRFGRPALEAEKKEAAALAPPGSGDMVELLLAQEAARKRELELKRQAEEAAAPKIEKLKNSTLEELRKQLASKGRDASGKKDDLVIALIRAGEEDDAAAKRKGELKAMDAHELKKLLQSKALEVGSKKDEMIDTYLAYEAKVRTEALAYGAKVAAVLEEKKSGLESKSQAQLKDECATKDLATGGSKEALVERLLESLKTDGEVDKILVAQARAARREELQATATEALVKLCAALGIDPLVKEVMVERILSHEEEVGVAVEEPAAKKARKSK